jgi:hypothetical protein
MIARGTLVGAAFAGAALASPTRLHFTTRAAASTPCASSTSSLFLSGVYSCTSSHDHNARLDILSYACYTTDCSASALLTFCTAIIAQLFEWNWASVQAECQTLADAGYTYVQVSPYVFSSLRPISFIIS